MEKIWWEQIPGANTFRSGIFKAISNEKDAVLISRNILPWRDYLCEKLKEDYRQSQATKSVEELFDVENPGEYLLQRFCKPEKRATYRPGRSFANFFAKSDDIVIHDRLFWVRLRDDSYLEPWVDFISEYAKERGKNIKKATFLIECISDKTVMNKKGVTAFFWENFVSDYDRFVFCMLAAASVGESTRIKKYLSELISNVIGNNVELCEKIVCNYLVFLSDPYTAVTNAINEVYHGGTAFVFSKKEEDVRHDIWVTQVRTVYPVLEDFRESFVSKYRNQILKNLPYESDYDEVYLVPEDVQLGILRYWMRKKVITVASDDGDELELHTEARNALSHLKAIDITTVRKILA